MYLFSLLKKFWWFLLSKTDWTNACWWFVCIDMKLVHYVWNCEDSVFTDIILNLFGGHEFLLRTVSDFKYLASITGFMMFPLGRMITVFIDGAHISISSAIRRIIPALQSWSSIMFKF